MVKNYLLEQFTNKMHSQQSLQAIYKVICYGGNCIEKTKNVECYFMNNFITIYIYFDCKGEKIKKIMIYEDIL